MCDAGAKVMLYLPRLDEMDFRQRLLADADTMSYNQAWGGTIDFSPKRWNEWYCNWLAGGTRYYRYVFAGATPVGEAAYHLDEKLGVYMCDVIILASQRRKGYGGAALELLCAAARQRGALELWDSIALDNPAVELFKRHGFTEEFRTDEAIFVRRALYRRESD